MKRDLTGNDHLSKMSTKRPAGYPSDKEIPVVLILKRKAIRVYPDNQKVVLYYSQALDKYISVPFGPNSNLLGSPLNESRKYKRDDDSEKTYQALAAEYPEIAKKYLEAKKTQPTRRAIRRVVGKLTPKEIMALPKAERDVAYQTAQEKLGAADISRLAKLGKQHNLAIRKFFADRKKETKPTPVKQPDPTEAMKNIKPKTVSESFRNKLSVLREERLDEVGPAVFAPAALGAAGRYIASTAAGAAAYETGKAGLKWVGKKGKDWLEGYKKSRREKEEKKKWEFMRRDKKGRGKGKKDKDSKLDKAADAATLGSAIAGGVEAGAEVAKSAVDAATKSGEKYGGRRETDFTAGGRQEVKVGDPRQGQVTTSAEYTRQQQKMLGVRESFESNIDLIKYMVENDISSHPIQIGEGVINLNNRVAKKVLKIYESLNKQNKKKIENMLNESATSFKKVINFAVRQ